MSDVDSNEGILLPAYKTLLTGICLEATLGLTVAIGGGTYQPVIYHRASGAFPKYTQLLNAFPQDETRTLRRRTVGRGV